MALTSREIAEQVAGRLIGDGEVRIDGVASLAEAGPHHLSFLGNDKYRPQMPSSQAGAVLIPESYTEPPPAGSAYIVCDNPSAAFSRYVVHFAPPEVRPKPGIHPRATVADGVTVPANTHVGPCAVIEPGAVIGEDTVIGAGCYIGHEARVGSHCLIYPNVTVRERCRLGDRVIVHSSTVIGSDGFGFEMGAEGHTKIPQYGIVQIDDDVEIGACVTIDRARFGRTWLKQGVKVDNLVQIAHNVVIGEHSLIIAQVGISGSVRIGRGVILAGQSGLPGHIEVGDGAVIMAASGPIGDVPPKSMLMGIPAVPRREFMRQAALVQRLPELNAQVKALEKQVAELKARLDAG